MSAGAARYAKALFQLAVEEGRIEEVRRDLSELSTLLEEHRLLRALYHSPATDRALRAGLLDELFRGRTSEAVINLLKLLAEKNRQALWPAIVREFDRLYRRSRNEREATVTAAVPLSDENAAQLKRLLEDRLKAHVLLEVRVEPQILGGLIIESEGQRLDLSLKRRLNELRKQLEC